MPLATANARPDAFSVKVRMQQKAMKRGGVITHICFKRTKSRSYETKAQNEDGDGIHVLGTHRAMRPHGPQVPCAKIGSVHFRGVTY